MRTFPTQPGTRGIRGVVRRGPTPVAAEPGRDVEVEVARLREENAHLRLEQQRALSVGRVAERVRDAVASIESAPAEQGDEAWAVYTEAAVIRETLVAVCNDLQVAVTQLQRQLVGTTPAPELDRRATDRRSRPSGVLRQGTGHRADPEVGPAASTGSAPRSAPVSDRRAASPVPTADRRRVAPAGATTAADNPSGALSGADAELSAVLAAYADRLTDRRVVDASSRRDTGLPAGPVHDGVHPYVAALLQRQP